MFRQVVLSTSKSKAPTHLSGMVQRRDEAAPPKHHLQELHFDSHRSFHKRKTLNRSLSWDELLELSRTSKSASTSTSKGKCRTQSARTADREMNKEKHIYRPQARQCQQTATIRETSFYKSSSMLNEIQQRMEPSTEDGRQICKKFGHVAGKLRYLAYAFRERAQRCKTMVIQPLSPPSTPFTEPTIQANNQFTNLFDEDWMVSTEKDHRSLWQNVLKHIKERRLGVFDPQSYVYIFWLLLVSLAFLYNSYGIFLRQVFHYQTPDNAMILLALDYLCDTIYLIDIIIFKCRLKFTQEGQLIEDPELTKKNYVRSPVFKFDCLSLLPLDLLYAVFGPNTFLRLPRLLKIHTFWEFFNRVDVVAKSPYAMRILKTLIYMTYLIHINAAAYYAMSEYEGFDANTWVYNNKGNAYIRCFYFAFRTATSISGKMVKPTNNKEYIFMINSWLNGVFVFAFLIGQIRDIVATATQNKQHFREIMDQTIRHMNNLNLPQQLQMRVRLWLSHTWEQQKLNEGKVLNLLPLKMRTDIAINIHYRMLSKVELFKDCGRMVLRDLVVKLKAVLFLPGDFICRKGEIGQEMYIISEGKVQVLGDNGETLVTLSAGSVFGEVSVLGIPGCSRRMADVRSLGFSNLFILRKMDLWETLANYPEAQSILRQKARRVALERNIGGSPSDIDAETIIGHSSRLKTPRLFRAVVEAISSNGKTQDSATVSTLRTSLRLNQSPRIISQATVSQCNSRSEIEVDESFDRDDCCMNTKLQRTESKSSCVDPEIVRQIVLNN